MNTQNCLNDIGGYIFKVDELSFYTLLRIVEAGKALQYDIEEFLKPFHISHGRFSILLTLYKYDGGPVSPSTLAAELNKKRPTITEMLKKLVHDALAVEIPDPGDGRKKRIKLGKEGFQLLERIIPVYNKRIMEMAKGLSEREKKLLMRLLSKLSMEKPVHED
jgi:DNA-binding MarR family transcriptional regulator